MYGRHDEVPVLSSCRSTVEARHFNLVYRALKKMGPEIRLALPGLKTLDLIVQTGAWIIVDRAFGDIPVAAWVGIDPGVREGIHEPVPCELRFYHGHARLILERSLSLMEEILTDRLRDGSDPSQVHPFSGGGD